jgi:hypothetical protein
MRTLIVALSTCGLLLVGIVAWAQNRLPPIPGGQVTEDQYRTFGHEPSVLSGDDIGIRLTGSVDPNGRVQGTLVAKINGKWVDVVTPTVAR